MLRNCIAKTILLMALVVVALLGATVSCQSDGEVDPRTVEDSNDLLVVNDSSGQKANTVSLSRARTLDVPNAVPLSDLLVPPQSVQDVVNRRDVVFTGTVARISDPVSEKPYDWKSGDDDHFSQNDLPLPRREVVYYDIELEEVFLDDGNLRTNPRLRIFGRHSAIRPQTGERFLFALGANPDGKSYGVAGDWCLIPLDGGPIRNFDGRSTGYVGVADETSLKDAVRAAVPKRVHLPMDQWPVQEKWLTDENAPSSGTPPAPGGDGDTGPVGVASE